jgi:hypothetical protein
MDAIVQNADSSSLFDDLDAALQSGSSEERVAMLRQITANGKPSAAFSPAKSRPDQRRSRDVRRPKSFSPDYRNQTPNACSAFGRSAR